MSTLTDSQREALNTFRTHVFKDGILKEGDTIGIDDETLLRFLRARKFNLQQSTKMFQDCQNWRKTAGGVGIDELYRRTDPFDYPEQQHVFESWPMWFHKTDKHGRPLNFHFYGSMDTNKLYSKMTPERHWETFMVNAELLPREILPAASRQAGKHVGTVYVIVDLKGFSVSQFWQMKTLARSAFQVSQDYYPETMGKVTVINAPSSFAYIFSVMKPWMAPETRQKVSILGPDYLKELLTEIDEDSLPSLLGGKCTCADQGGCAMSGAGPWMDGRKGWGPKTNGSADGVAPGSPVKEASYQTPDSTTATAKEDTKPEPNGTVSTSPTSTDAQPNGAVPPLNSVAGEKAEPAAVPPNPSAQDASPPRGSWFSTWRRQK